MAIDPRIQKLTMTFEDKSKNPYYFENFDQKMALDSLRKSSSKTGLVFRRDPEHPAQYLLIIKVDNKPSFLHSEDIPLEISLDGYVLTTVDGKETYLTIEALLTACRNFADILDEPDSLPSEEDYLLAKKYFESSFQNSPPKELEEFMKINALTMEDLICNISFELMREPMLGPEPKLRYDKVNIEGWLAKDGALPTARKPATIQDFQRDVKVMQANNLIIKLAKECEVEQLKEKEKEKKSDLLFSFEEMKKKKEEAEFRFQSPQYHYDWSRNLFNLVLASEALMNQFPGKEKGFKPRIDLNSETGLLTINFAEIKHGWSSAEAAAKAFLNSFKNAGIEFENPKCEANGLITLQGHDIIMFAKFCNMPKTEVEYMFHTRKLHFII